MTPLSELIAGYDLEETDIGAEAQKRQRDAETKRLADVRRVQREWATEAGVPAKDMELLSVGTAMPTEAMASVSAMEGRKLLMILSGRPGCGKTTAASSWIWEWAFRAADRSVMLGGLVTGKPSIIARFVTSAKLARWPRYDGDQMDKLLRAPRVVIDDLGAEYADDKGNFSAILDETVNERYASHRSTLITTNLDATAFKTRYGERLIDRIREVGEFVSIAAPSMRGGSR